MLVAIPNVIIWAISWLPTTNRFPIDNYHRRHVTSWSPNGNHLITNRQQVIIWLSFANGNQVVTNFRQWVTSWLPNGNQLVIDRQQVTNWYQQETSDFDGFLRFYH